MLLSVRLVDRCFLMIVAGFPVFKLADASFVGCTENWRLIRLRTID